MKRSRRSNHFLGSTALAALIVLGVVCFSSNALSAEWPSKPIEFVTHSSPGGPGNLIGQLLADINRKAQILSQPIYVSVKPGSGMAKAFSYIMEKKGDDHIIGVTSSGNILGTPLRVKVPYTFKTFTPIANFAVDGSVMVVSTKGPFKTMDDVFAEAKKNPGKITQGGSSMNSDEAMMGKAMQRIKGVSWKFVSFDKEVESVTAVLGGHINMAFVNPTSCTEQVRAGNLKVILVAAPQRYKAFPDAPTVEEADLGRSRASYRAVFGPPDMPKYAQKGWETAMKKFIAHEQFQKYMADAMMQEKYMNGEELGAYWEKAGALVKQDFIDAGMLNPDGSIKEKR